MPVDIRTIPLDVLIKDLQDSEKDIHDCQAALLLGVTEYSEWMRPRNNPAEIPARRDRPE
jgi:hypothetical protein